MFGDVIPGNDRIPRSGMSNQKSSSHKVCVVWKTPAFSVFNVAKETLVIDLTLCKNGNCEENGSITVIISCMCALSLVLVRDMIWIAAGMSFQLLCNTGRTLNYGKCLFFQHGKVCSKLYSFLLGTGKDALCSW